MITREELDAVRSLDEVEATVRARIEEAQADAATLLRFIHRFTTWNSEFGCGVAALSAAVGRCRQVFVDPDEPLRACADRSVHVASFIFAAARDEFDDSATTWLDTHRCLAQAFLKGTAQELVRTGAIRADAVDGLLANPGWLDALIRSTAQGYGDGAAAADPAGVYRALGYHLGSEVLADREFSAIDAVLRARRPALVDALLRLDVPIGDGRHRGYYWLGIHSGLGGGVEADHFEDALEGVRLAFRYTAPAQHGTCREALLTGFRAFAADHDTFFRHVNR